MKSEIIGSYFNTNELLKLIIKADTTLIIKSELGEFNYRIEGYEKHRLRKMTWLTLTDMKSPEKIASLQIFMKKGDAYLVVLSEPRLGGLDVSYLHR